VLWKGHHQWALSKCFAATPLETVQPVVDVDHVRYPEFLRQLTNSFLKEMIEEQNPGVKGGGGKVDCHSVDEEGPGFFLVGRTWKVQGGDMDLMAHHCKFPGKPFDVS